jgi:hypothetical protein
MNSYGRNWGEKGFFYFPYDDFNKLVRECYLGWITKVNNPLAPLAVVNKNFRKIEKNKPKIEEFHANTIRNYDDFQIVNLGYDSVQNFAVFRLLREDKPPINFILRPSEIKTISLNKTKTIQLNFSSTDSTKKVKSINVGMTTRDYKSDFQILHLKEKLNYDLSELQKIRNLSDDQKKIAKQIENF